MGKMPPGLAAYQAKRKAGAAGKKKAVPKKMTGKKPTASKMKSGKNM